MKKKLTLVAVSFAMIANLQAMTAPEENSGKEDGRLITAVSLQPENDVSLQPENDNKGTSLPILLDEEESEESVNGTVVIEENSTLEKDELGDIFIDGDEKKSTKLGGVKGIFKDEWGNVKGSFFNTCSETKDLFLAKFAHIRSLRLSEENVAEALCLQQSGDANVPVPTKWERIKNAVSARWNAISAEWNASANWGGGVTNVLENVIAPNIWDDCATLAHNVWRGTANVVKNIVTPAVLDAAEFLGTTASRFVIKTGIQTVWSFLKFAGLSIYNLCGEDSQKNVESVNEDETANVEFTANSANAESVAQ